MTLTTTLNAIREHSPCSSGWKKLLAHLGKTEADDEPLAFETILDSNGLNDALWCCRAAPQYAKEWRLFAVWCARQVQHLMKDQRSLDALDVAERFAHGNATAEELVRARDAAYAAYDAAAYDAAYDAAAYDDAAYAAYAAYDDAAYAAAYDAAAYAAAYDAAAYDAAYDAAAYDAASQAQAAQFRKVIRGEA